MSYPDHMLERAALEQMRAPDEGESKPIKFTEYARLRALENQMIRAMAEATAGFEDEAPRRSAADDFGRWNRKQ